MSGTVLESGSGNKIDVKEVFTLLESQESQVTDSINTLINENLASTKESWLIHSLVEYYFISQSSSVLGILCSVQDPHDKHLLEKIYDGIKSQEHQLLSLQLLLHVVCKQPLWVNKVITMSVLKLLIKTLKVETNIPVLMTGVTIVTVLLPSIPGVVGPYLPDIFEVFFRLASFHVKKPPGNTPDIFYLHLQIAVYALFHRLYGMFPYNFLTHIRHFCGKKENLPVFEDVLKSMIERVRLHPQLITGNKDQETSLQRWKQLETHDVVAECNKMSLDPVEGTWEELQCPIIASRQLMDKSTYHPNPSHPHLQQTAALPSVAQISVHEFSPVAQGQDVFWSPSEMIGLSTPPASQRATPAAHLLETSGSGQFTHSGVTVSVNPVITPGNTPRETPPVHEDSEQVTSGSNSRGVPNKLLDPKRLSAELPTHIPLLTPSSAVQSIPPSPLKTEFTSIPPQVAKPLPVLHAARELQFDQDQSSERPIKQLSKLNQSQTEFTKHVTKTDQSDGTKVEAKTEDMKIEAKVESKSAQPVKAPSRSSSVTFLEDSIKYNSNEMEDSTKSLSKDASGVDSGARRGACNVTEVVGAGGSMKEDLVKTRTMSDASTTSQLDTISIDNLSQVIGNLESHEEDGDDEVTELTSSSPLSNSANMTAESVKMFMKGVNRIRFNSLTVSNNMDSSSKKMGRKHRSRSCPQFPKIHTMTEEETSRSASTTCNDSNDNPPSAPVSIDDSNTSATSQVTNNSYNVSVASSKNTVTMTTQQQTSLTITSCSSTEVIVGKCPVYTRSVSGTEHRCDDFIQILQQALNASCGVVCSKCQGHMTEAPAGEQAFFSTFSPSELLDRHISLGRDIHAKQLSKIPIPSTQDINWTHFGGVPPADEISILRGQLTLLHNQLMFERHKRDQHAKRNRRLLRKITNTVTLEEKNAAKSEQLRDLETEIRELKDSIRSLQEENRKLKGDRDSEENVKLVHLRSCLQENEDLKNVKKEFNMLLVRQREEQDSLQKKLMATEAKLFNTSHELEKLKEVAVMNQKLKEQVLHLHKEILLLGELQQKSSEKLAASKSCQAINLEYENIKQSLHIEIKQLKHDLRTKSLQVENYRCQLKELQESILVKDTAIIDLKTSLEKIKAGHDDEIKSVDDKHKASLRVNQELESCMLELYAEIEQLKSKLHHAASGASNVNMKPQSPDLDDIPEFRERTNCDPLQQESSSLRSKTLTRMTSLPVSTESNDQSANDAQHSWPTGGVDGASGGRSVADLRVPELRVSGSRVLEHGVSEARVSEPSVSMPRVLLEEDEIQRKGDTVSISSREFNIYPGPQHLLYTDSEDNRSGSNKSNLDDLSFS